MQLFHKFINWYFSRNALPYWCILAADCLILLLFYLFGYYCFLGGTLLVDYFWLGLYCSVFCFI